MQTVIEKHIKVDRIKNKEQCVETLLTAGLKVLDADNLVFTESHNFTTHSGKNKLKLFSPLLHGKISFDTERESIKWDLSITDLLAKSILTFTILTLVWQFLIQGIWGNSLLIGGVVGAIVFAINWLNLNDKVERLTNKMTVK